MRGHGNFTENVPIALLLLLGLEIQSLVPSSIIGSLATMFVIGRLSHAYAFYYIHPIMTHLRYRTIGMVLTTTFTAVAALLLLVTNLLFY